jgi:hypothetical protein
VDLVRVVEVVVDTGAVGWLVGAYLGGLRRHHLQYEMAA